MIHPTRTNLLILKEKSRSVANSIGILKARRQALVREFLATTLPFLQGRQIVRDRYGQALLELALAARIEGEEFLEALEDTTARRLEVEIIEKSLMGLRYRDVSFKGKAVREINERGYDIRNTTPHGEEAFFLFETIIEEMAKLAAFESKLKRLGEEIVRVTRRTRVLEERILPDLRGRIRSIVQYLGEREREDYYRLKRFKTCRS
ncbi:MAG: ATPase [Desulfuromonadales bacterium GWD2_54_10]|nr:MAG: ATPase [Desulfuromonadales bacterium GWD2_54_10]